MLFFSSLYKEKEGGRDSLHGFLTEQIKNYWDCRSNGSDLGQKWRASFRGSIFIDVLWGMSRYVLTTIFRLFAPFLPYCKKQKVWTHEQQYCLHSMIFPCSIGFIILPDSFPIFESVFFLDRIHFLLHSLIMLFHLPPILLYFVHSFLYHTSVPAVLGS